MSRRPRVAALIASALAVIGAEAWAAAQGTPTPRPGLTAQQTKQAVEIAREGMIELRKKTEGTAKPKVDLREYVVGVELLTDKDSEKPSPASDRPQANPAGAEGGPERTPKKQESEKPAAKAARHRPRARAAGPGHFVPLFR